MKFRFKEETPAGMLIVYLNNIYLNLIDQRKQEAEKIRVKYPERIPVIKKQRKILTRKITINLGCG